MAISDLDFAGSNGIITKSYGTLVLDRTSLASCTAVFQIRKDNWEQLLFGPDATHPVFTFLGLSHLELNFDGAFAVATCKFEGIQGGPLGTQPVYELVVGTSEEPIATHPNFPSKLGGTAVNPLNGANFRNVDPHVAIPIANAQNKADNNSGYVFDSYDVNIGEVRNKYAGVQSYLDVCATYRKTWNVPVSVSQLLSVGSISSPDGPVPRLAPGRNWLDMGLTSTKHGSAYQLVQEWRASGRSGWNTDIYRQS